MLMYLLTSLITIFMAGGSPQPEQLTEYDSTKIALPYGADGTVVPIQKFRDVQKLYAAMTDEEIMKFQSSLREVMLFIKYSKDRENLSKVLVTNEKRFRELERRAADVIEAITNSGIKYDEEDEVVNVCQAIQEMRKESERDGELKKAREAAGKLYEMGLDTDKIAQAVGYAVETVKGWLGLES